MPHNPDVSTALHRAIDRTSRRTGLRAVLFLVVAALAATGSAVLLTRYMDARTAGARVPTERVVVAEVDLPVGTEIRPEHLRVVDWPTSSRPEGAFGDATQVAGRVVTSRVFKNEPISQARLAGGSAGGLAALLAPGMRAVAVRVDDVVGVAGFVHPGDVVDVIATLRVEGAPPIVSARVILQNIKVLAVGADLDAGGAKGEKPKPATVATLQVDPAQSERLALAATQGKLLLSLRSAADTVEVATSGIMPQALVATAPPKPPPDDRKGVKVAKTEPAPKDETIEILRGDLYERRKFGGGRQ